MTGSKLSAKEIIFIIFLFLFCFNLYAQKDKVVTSPDSTISVEIKLQEKIYYSITYKGKRVLEASPLSITISDKTLGGTLFYNHRKPSPLTKPIQPYGAAEKKSRTIITN